MFATAIAAAAFRTLVIVPLLPLPKRWHAMASTPSPPSVSCPGMFARVLEPGASTPPGFVRKPTTPPPMAAFLSCVSLDAPLLFRLPPFFDDDRRFSMGPPPHRCIALELFRFFVLVAFAMGVSPEGQHVPRTVASKTLTTPHAEGHVPQEPRA